MKENKYIYARVLQSNCGYGWDDEIIYKDQDDFKEIKADLKAYRDNCPSMVFRIIERRIRK